MSRTEDIYLESRARYAGYLAGKYGESKINNPYYLPFTHIAWLDGWEDGRKEFTTPKARWMIEADPPAFF